MKSDAGCTSSCTSDTISRYTSGTISGYTSGHSCTAITISGNISGTTSGQTSGTTSNCPSGTTSRCPSGCTSYTTYISNNNNYCNILKVLCFISFFNITCSLCETGCLEDRSFIIKFEVCKCLKKTFYLSMSFNLRYVNISR